MADGKEILGGLEKEGVNTGIGLAKSGVSILRLWVAWWTWRRTNLAKSS